MWWTTVDSSAIVKVCYPYERHGNAGKVSNSAKTSVMNDFLSFVDTNSQPNGRSADSTGPTSYFISKFSTIQTPKPSVKHYNDRLTRSVVGEFNRVQAENGREGCSNGSAHNWLKKYRPKVSIICPHKQDYCDTCSKLDARVKEKQTILNRLLQSGSASSEDIKDMEKEISAINSEREAHCQNASKSHEHYIECTRKCSRELEQILVSHEEDEGKVLKQNFTLVISADYQMSKLVPHWGLSPQPASTYYLQKLSHDIFGIVDHSKIYPTSTCLMSI